MHGPPGDGGGDEHGEEHQPDKIPRKEGDDIGDGGAQDLADADLLYPLLRREGGEADEAETGNEDGDDGEKEDKSGDLLVGFVKVVELIVQESVIERFVVNILSPNATGRSDGAGGLTRCYFYKKG